MTSEPKAKVRLTARRGVPPRSQPKGRPLLLVGMLLALAVPEPVLTMQQTQHDLWREISPEGSVNISVTGASPSEAYEHLESLGLVPGSVADPEVVIYGNDAFRGVQEAKADWAVRRLALNGKFAVRQSVEALGQAMTVTSVISPDGLLTTDDWGGSRIETYREFPVATCYSSPERFGCDGVVSFDMARDKHGTIVEFVRDSQGLPIAVRFGETLALRYSFAPPLPERPKMGRLSDRWRPPSAWELIDVRTSEIVIDSVDAAKVASERVVVSVGFQGSGEVLRVEDGHPLAVALGVRYAPYALLPLGTTSDVWRIVYASGDMSQEYRFRVDYTDDLVRVEINASKYGRSVVVEAPRSRESAAPVSIVHPGADTLTAAMRSGVRLRATEPVDAWLHSTFDNESLPVVLRPLHNRGIDMESGVVRATEASVEYDLQFGPADGCEEKDQGIRCSDGKSDVIGEESPHPY